jgi:hypothetical protein
MRYFYTLVSLVTIAFNLQAQNTINHSAFDAVRIIAVSGIDNGSLDSESASYSFDVIQDLCDEDEEIYEPFYDSLIAFTIINESSNLIRISSIKFKLRESGRTIRTRRVMPIGNTEIPAKEEKNIYSLFLDASEGFKYFNGSDQPISENLGIKNISIIVNGYYSNGRKFRIKSKVAFGFGNEDRCE